MILVCNKVSKKHLYIPGFGAQTYKHAWLSVHRAGKQGAASKPTAECEEDSDSVNV